MLNVKGYISVLGWYDREKGKGVNQRLIKGLIKGIRRLEDMGYIFAGDAIRTYGKRWLLK